MHGHCPSWLVKLYTTAPLLSLSAPARSASCWPPPAGSTATWRSCAWQPASCECERRQGVAIDLHACLPPSPKPLWLLPGCRAYSWIVLPQVGSGGAGLCQQGQACREVKPGDRQSEGQVVADPLRHPVNPSHADAALLLCALPQQARRQAPARVRAACMVSARHWHGRAHTSCLLVGQTCSSQTSHPCSPTSRCSPALPQLRGGPRDVAAGCGGAGPRAPGGAGRHRQGLVLRRRVLPAGAPWPDVQPARAGLLPRRLRAGPARVLPRRGWLLGGRERSPGASRAGTPCAACALPPLGARPAACPSACRDWLPPGCRPLSPTRPPAPLAVQCTSSQPSWCTARSCCRPPRRPRCGGEARLLLQGLAQLQCCAAGLACTRARR